MEAAQRFVAVVLLWALRAVPGWAGETSAPKTIEELETAIRSVLTETKTPGAGVALVTRDRAAWVAGLGKADVASGREATADTLFRIGSVSKTFVALSILMLEEEGRLRLEDPVRHHLPDVAENPWEGTDPVRIVDLLAHTSGFDDLRFSEYALEDPRIGLAEALAYRPDQGIGYAFMINSGNGDAAERIQALVEGHLTHALAKPEPPPRADAAAAAQAFGGYYRLDNPRVELMRFVVRLLVVARVTVDGSTLTIEPLLGKREEYLAVGQRRYRRTSREPQPAASLALASALGLWPERGLALASLLLMASAPLFALVWVPRKLLGGLRGVRHLHVRVVPLLSVLCLAAALALLAAAGADPIQRLGKPTAYSVGFCAATIAFALTAVVGLALALAAPAGEMNRWARRHVIAVATACALVAAYLLRFGIIGLRTWT